MNMNWMKHENWPYTCKKERAVSLWKVFGVLGLLFGAVMALVSLCLKQKNDEYRDALIDLSERFPGEEDAEPDTTARREDWQSAHAPSNRKTVEERLADQRIQEGM